MTITFFFSLAHALKDLLNIILYHKNNVQSLLIFKDQFPPLSQKTWQCLCYEPLESDVKILCFQKYVYLISQFIKTTN